MKKSDSIFTFIKKNWVLLGALFFVFATSCKQPAFEIKGELPDSQFNGEWIYLVPTEPHTVNDVDSVLIENSSFVFHGDIERVAVIRMPMKQRMQVQELLVVTEPGQIDVTLDSVSNGGGTAQNDALQKWKTYRGETLTKLLSARELAQKDSTRALESEVLIEKFKNESKAFNYGILKEMGDNTLGNFLYNQVKVAVPDDKKAEIDSLFKTNEK
ncbi:DUF4369 domain-containing protein [uncultured Draconibacterium sp.]|uniref:DUF4369 domain-containing protein n=1 Tax=uncultured Draconibacterium sp. TaxID=1573823 RepID=UPI0025DB4454|nr:DUF4369 domain-containing protein [uncultured Draconibacterium sp.]